VNKLADTLKMDGAVRAILGGQMHAIVRPTRIDIEGATAVATESWQPMLDELQAEHVPGLTPNGKRMMVAVTPSGRMDGSIYRTTSMADEDVIRILRKYGIEANAETDLAQGAIG
jgi:hypothetical protein